LYTTWTVRNRGVAEERAVEKKEKPYKVRKFQREWVKGYLFVSIDLII